MTSVASPASATISKVAALLSAPRAKRCIELGPPVRPSFNAGCGSTRKSPWAEMGRSSPAMGRTLLTDPSAAVARGSAMLDVVRPSEMEFGDCKDASL